MAMVSAARLNTMSVGAAIRLLVFLFSQVLVQASAQYEAGADLEYAPAMAPMESPPVDYVPVGSPDFYAPHGSPFSAPVMAPIAPPVYAPKMSPKAAPAPAPVRSQSPAPSPLATGAAGNVVPSFLYGVIFMSVAALFLTTF